MRTLVVHMMATVDGFTAGPDGALGWIDVDDPDLDHYLAELLGSVDAQLFGRVSYELLGGYWPEAERNPATPGDAMLAPLVNGLPKLVLSSRSDLELPWQPATRIGADLGADIAALKHAPGRPVVVFAGATTARELLRRNVVDEIRLLVYPTVLGAGQRLFDAMPGPRLAMTGTRSFPKSGVVLLNYRVERDQ